MHPSGAICKDGAYSCLLLETIRFPAEAHAWSAPHLFPPLFRSTPFSLVVLTSSAGLELQGLWVVAVIHTATHTAAGFLVFLEWHLPPCDRLEGDFRRAACGIVWRVHCQRCEMTWLCYLRRGGYSLLEAWWGSCPVNCVWVWVCLCYAGVGWWAVGWPDVYIDCVKMFKTWNLSLSTFEC